MLFSLGVAVLAAALVLGLWYPFPYLDLAGGRELLLLVISVDVICGPLLTSVLFNSAKPPAELWRDLGLVAIIQLGALGYGLWTVWEARPLFLALEIDRFKVVSKPDLRAASMAILPDALQPHWWLFGPISVATREPRDLDEKQKVMFESIQGGADYGNRPDFYLPYEGAAALKSLNRAKSLTGFLKKYPDQRSAAQSLVDKVGLTLNAVQYLPVIGREDWIALLNDQGMVVGFLKGDGF